MKKKSSENIIIIVDNNKLSSSQTLIQYTWLLTSALFISMLIIFVTVSTSASSSFQVNSFGLFSGSESNTKTMPEVSVVQLLKKVTTFGSDHDDHRAIIAPAPAPAPDSGGDDEFYSQFDKGIHRSLPVIKEESKVEQGLATARKAIRKASFVDHKNISSGSSVYHHPTAFYQSYAEMEKRLKVYVYKEGELPIVHDGPCKDIYSSEGRFIHEMEHGTHKFRTKNPHSAYLFFMPFSVTWMVKYIYKPNTFDVTPLMQFVSDYVRVISSKHPFWKRSSGADHFMLSCHDWGPHASRGNPVLYNTAIRVLCNANSSEGFNPEKDVSLPELKLFGNFISPKLKTPPPANTSRPYLAFFAGGKHGPIRPILLDHWKGRDADLLVYEYLPKTGLLEEDYFSFILRSKFCLCPSGYEVASPRIVEAIYAECVPVILSNHYVLPFSDVLNWDKFSIKVEIDDIPRLKEILMAVPEDKYLRLKEGLRSVRQHFLLHEPSQKFDMFHMILHSVWLRRLNFRIG